MNLLSTVLAAAGGATIDLRSNAAAGTNVTNLTISGLISFAITAIIIIAGLIFFFMLVIGGLKWILSGGDKGQTESARSQITAALVGLVILFSAWAIATLVEQIFNVSILSFTIPTISG